MNYQDIRNRLHAIPNFVLKPTNQVQQNSGLSLKLKFLFFL